METVQPPLAAGGRLSPYLAVLWILVVEDDLDPVGDPLPLMDAHLALGGLHAAQGHLVQQLTWEEGTHRPPE